ncbi:MAG: GNAT family N-acetyltransferase [candidate division WOR-3 bacterium]
MIAELLTFEQIGPLEELLLRMGNGMFPGEGVESLDPETTVSRILRRLSDITTNGGTTKVYTVRGRASGMIVVGQDEWAFRELGRPGYRIECLVALGRLEEQLFVKTLLVHDVLKTLPRGNPLVARVPHTDVTGINVLGRHGFVATQTALMLAAEIGDTDATETPVDSYYGVVPAEPEDIDRLDDGILRIPDGVFGWDAYLPCGVRSKVHRDWLQSYTRHHGLLLAFHHDRLVGLLAEHFSDEQCPTNGNQVAHIDLITAAAEYRNNGVTGTLMNHAFRQFRTRGIRRVELTIHFADAPTVNQLEKGGFTALGSSLVMTNWRGMEY